MPKLIASVPKYRRHRASGQAIVTLNGRDHYLGPHGTKSSKAEFERIIGLWLAAGRTLRRSAVDCDTTIAELSAAYLRFADGYYRKDGVPTRTIERVRLAIRVLRDLYGPTLAADFGPLCLQAIQTQLVRQQKSRRYVNYLVEEIKRIIKWGVSRELVPPVIYQGLATVSGLRKGRSEAREAAPILPVEEATVEATLPHVPAVVADMVRLQRLAGMRPGEVCIVRPCDVDRSADVWAYRPSSHKTEYRGRERVIFLGPRAQAILTPYLLRPADSYCFSPKASEDARHRERGLRRQTRVQPSQARRRRKRRPEVAPGDRYTTGSYGRAIDRGCVLAWPAPDGLKQVEVRQWNREHRWRPNRLRHAAATEIRRRFGLEAVQTVLGHAHANVSQMYAERDMAKAATVMREVG